MKWHICTAVNREFPLSMEELMSLERVKNESLKYCIDEAKFYFRKCDLILSEMRGQGGRVRDLVPFVKLVIKYEGMFGAEYALDFYKDYVEELLRIYVPVLHEEFKKNEKKWKSKKRKFTFNESELC